MDNVNSPNPQLEDKIIICQDCGINFIFTAGEQRFYLDRGLAMPKRCPKCRLSRRLGLKGGK